MNRPQRPASLEQRVVGHQEHKERGVVRKLIDFVTETPLKHPISIAATLAYVDYAYLQQGLPTSEIPNLYFEIAKTLCITAAMAASIGVEKYVELRKDTLSHSISNLKENYDHFIVDVKDKIWDFGWDFAKKVTQVGIVQHPYEAFAAGVGATAYIHNADETLLGTLAAGATSYLGTLMFKSAADKLREKTIVPKFLTQAALVSLLALCSLQVGQAVDAQLSTAQSTQTQEAIEEFSRPIFKNKEVNDPAFSHEYVPGQYISEVFTPEIQAWGPQIARWASTYNLDPNLLATVLQIESCADPHAVSRGGALGLAQVMPYHFSPGQDPFDPDTNISVGMTNVLVPALEEYGSLNAVLAAYNGGPKGADLVEGKISREDYVNYLIDNGWSYSQANSKPNQVYRYVKWANIYNELSQGHSPTLEEWLKAGGASLCRQASSRIQSLADTGVSEYEAMHARLQRAKQQNPYEY